MKIFLLPWTEDKNNQALVRNLYTGQRIVTINKTYDDLTKWNILFHLDNLQKYSKPTYDINDLFNLEETIFEKMSEAQAAVDACLSQYFQFLPNRLTHMI